MSTVSTASVPRPRRAPAAPEPLPRPARPRLRVVPPPASKAARAPFVILVITLLSAGLVGLLLLNTALAQGSFVLHELEKRTAVLADAEQALSRQVAAAAAPDQLASKANALGMVRPKSVNFVNPGTRRITGNAPPAVAPATPAPKATAKPTKPAKPAAKPTKPTAKPTKPTAKPTAKAKKPRTGTAARQPRAATGAGQPVTTTAPQG